VRLFLFFCLSIVVSNVVLAKTSMEKVLINHNDSLCYAPLVSAAEKIISKKTHRLMTTLNNDSNEPVVISGVIEYKDRQSHINFAAILVNGQCRVKSTESFTFKLPCITVRQEVFKKWQMKGILNNTTLVLAHSRDAKQIAYLSDASDGSYCLVSRHNQF
tara:strand:- start:1037 stop:1516 length:480 start_codon:yes stop_codon:yes gene_type:complete